MKNELIWVESIRLEEKSISQHLLSKALQDLPSSGLIWAEAIRNESLHSKKAKAYDALKANDSSVHIALELALLFWTERKIEKAGRWFDRATKLDPDYGDAWIDYYKFVKENDPERLEEIMNECIKAEP